MKILSRVATRGKRAELSEELDMAALVSRTRRRHSLGTHVKSPGLQARVGDRCLLPYTGVPFSRPVVVSGAHSCVRACVHAWRACMLACMRACSVPFCSVPFDSLAFVCREENSPLSLYPRDADPRSVSFLLRGIFFRGETLARKLREKKNAARRRVRVGAVCE